MLGFDCFEWISFDCYGTLVDWETGISNAVGEVLQAHGMVKSRAEVLALFADAEPKVQGSGDYLEYRVVLRRVMEAIGAEVGLRCTESEAGCLADTLPDWPVFPDVPAALTTLGSRYRLAVISNVDDDLFAGTARTLGVEFDVVVTAQQVRGYKPNLRNFSVAEERMAVDRKRWLHVAESLYHDIGGRRTVSASPARGWTAPIAEAGRAASMPFPTWSYPIWRRSSGSCVRPRHCCSQAMRHP